MSEQVRGKRRQNEKEREREGKKADRGILPPVLHTHIMLQGTRAFLAPGRQNIHHSGA